MNPEKLEYFRGLLHEEKRKILSNATETIKGGLELSTDDMPDENDMASALYDQGFTLRLRDRERGLLSKIDRAIRRIDEGEYGYCEVCDDEIGFRRLEARPVTTMCIECKEEAERTERSYASTARAAAARKRNGRVQPLTGSEEDLDFGSEPEEDIEIDLEAHT